MKRVGFPQTFSQSRESPIAFCRRVFLFEIQSFNCNRNCRKCIETSGFNKPQAGPALAKLEVEIVEIHYSDREHVGDGRTRAYAHYRVFEAFRCVASQVRTVDVAVGRDRRAGYAFRVTCTVRAELPDGEHVSATATGDWPYAAIQQAATQARQQMDGKLASCEEL